MCIELARTSTFGNRTVVGECRLPMELLSFDILTAMLKGKGTSLLSVKWMAPRSVLRSDLSFQMALHLEIEKEILKAPRTVVEKMPLAVQMERLTA